jgi:hypothetical protein
MYAQVLLERVVLAVFSLPSYYFPSQAPSTRSDDPQFTYWFSWTETWLPNVSSNIHV